VLQQINITGKLNGARGNFNALVIAQPDKDWIAFSNDFVSSLGLAPTLITTQVESMDTLVQVFHAAKRINNILLDCNRDLWMYISYDYFKLKKKEGEVGSSTMPHKVNPIDFENSEGNLKIANGFFHTLESLQISRMQRDLSNSTMLRNVGVGFAHSILAFDSCAKGLGKLLPNLEKIAQDLEDHPEVLTEAVQTVLRHHGQEQAYEQLKELSRGKAISLEMLRNFIDSLALPENDKMRLKQLTPSQYIGLAAELVNSN